MENVELCELKHVHEDIVKEVFDKMPADEELFDLAELFKVFGDSTRIRILNALLVLNVVMESFPPALEREWSVISPRRVAKHLMKYFRVSEGQDSQGLDGR